MSRRKVDTTDHITSAPGLHAVKGAEIDAFRKAVLSWYDKNARTLPWRAPQGVSPDPYHVWLSEIMLQQTVVAAVIPYFTKFVDKWPNVAALAAAPQDDVMQAWAGLGYYARARNLHKCAQAVAGDHGGAFPDTQDALMTLPGIGEYTGAAVAAIAFDRPATVIDGNVDRVIARYFAVAEPFPGGKKAVRHFATALAADRTDRPGDFAQAMMDIGATVCIPKGARCGLCPVAATCRGRAAGIQDELPRKAAKKPKPQKHGFVYWVTDGRGRVLLERRAESAMMGGMMALPVAPWVETAEKPAHDRRFSSVLSIKEQKSLRVSHSFTHFDLILRGCRVEGAKAADFKAPQYRWVAPDDVLAAGLPSLFTKAVKLFLPGRGHNGV